MDTAFALISRPHLIRVLGRGSYGTVYLIERRDKIMALKVMATSDPAPDLAQAIGREFSTLRDLRGIEGVPGVFSLITFITHGNESWWGYGMEYIPGPTLADQIRKVRDSSGQVTDVLLLKLAFRLASILVEIASRGYIHRDIKPSNIVLKEPFYEPYLIDYGGACRPSHCRGLVGSLLYFDNSLKRRHRHEAEQYLPLADVYSLGRTLQSVWQNSLHMEVEAAIFEPTELVSKLLEPVLALDPNSRPSMEQYQELCRDLLAEYGINDLSLYSPEDIVGGDLDADMTDTETM